MLDALAQIPIRAVAGALIGVLLLGDVVRAIRYILDADRCARRRHP